MTTFRSRVRVGLAVAGMLFIGSPAFAQDANCELTNPAVGGARLEVTVTRPSINYRYDYVVVNPATSTGCVRGAMIDVRTQVSGGTLNVGPGIMHDPATDAPGSFVVAGDYSVPSVPHCAGGLGGIGRFDWGCVDAPVAVMTPEPHWEFVPGHKAYPGDSMPVFSIESPFPPGAREYLLFVDWDWDPDNNGRPFSISNTPNVVGMTVGPTDPSELSFYEGDGGEPASVNAFLSYTSPLLETTRTANSRFPLALRYGPTTLASTFRAILNGTDITSSFHPSAGRVEAVTLPLIAGSNTIVLSIDGRTASGETATDADHLVFLVGSNTPIATPDAVVVAEDGSITSAVLANDSGLGDVPLTLTIATAPGHGSATVNPNLTITYAPAPDFFGTDTYSYTVRDLDGHSAAASVTVTVTSVNDVPVAAPDALIVAEDESVTSDVLANDTGLGDVPLSLTIAVAPANGLVGVAPDRTITYTPAPNFFGADTFSYTVTDLDGESSTASVAVTVTSVNDPPLALGTFSPAVIGVPIEITIDGSDVEDCEITFSVTVPPTLGTLGAISAMPCTAGTPSSDRATVVYTASATGADSFTFRVQDANGAFADALVEIFVTPPGAALLGVHTEAHTAFGVDAAETLDDGSCTSSPCVLSSLSESSGGGSSSTASARASRGSLAASAAGSSENSEVYSSLGSAFFTLTDLTFIGPDATVCGVELNLHLDGPLSTLVGSGARSFAEVAFQADVAGNAFEGTLTLRNGIYFSSAGLLFDVTDPSDVFLTTPGFCVPTGQSVPLTLSLATRVEETSDDFNVSSTSFSTTLSFPEMGPVFELPPGFTADAPSAGIVDNHVGGQPGDEVPVAAPDAVDVAEDGSVTSDVLANDTGLGDVPVSLAIAVAPGHGSATVNVDLTVNYVPAPGFFGTDTYSYTATDADGDSSTANVAVTVTPVNDPPVALRASAAGVLGVPVEFAIHGTDQDDCELAFSIVVAPTLGTLGQISALPCTPGAPGSDRATVTYTASATGLDSITFRVQDAAGASSNAVVSIATAAVRTPVPTNQAPDCSTAATAPTSLWPPNHEFIPISIVGVTDADGDPVAILPSGVRQDEAVREQGAGSGNSGPDATLVPLAVRAERNGDPKEPGDGRVYHVAFSAFDEQGAFCSGSVIVCVPHDQRPGATCVDGGPLFDSLVP